MIELKPWMRKRTHNRIVSIMTAEKKKKVKETEHPKTQNQKYNLRPKEVNNSINCHRDRHRYPDPCEF